MNEIDRLVQKILEHHPAAQAIYLYGSYGSPYERPESDIDIAVLLAPHKAKEAKEAGLLALSDVQFELEQLLKREVDLINLRQAPTVLQKEVIAANRRIYQADAQAANEFEMLTLSYYQKLNEERAEIIADAIITGRLIA